MKYRELTPNEIEAYDIGYKVGNRKIVITDIEWESENEHKIYRKGYMAGLMDYKRNVNNVSIVSKVNNVEIETSTTSITPTTPIGISIRKGNMVMEEKEKGGVGEKEKANENSLFHVDCQNFDEIPQDILLVMKKYWTDEKIEKIRKDLACMPSHDTNVAILLTKYDSDLLKQAEIKPKKKQVEVADYGEYEYLRPQITKWLDYKKSRGESYKSSQSLMVLAKKIHELSGGNESVADQIIEQSIANNWAGIFALKQQQPKKEKQNFAFYVGEGSFLKPDGEW